MKGSKVVFLSVIVLVAGLMLLNTSAFAQTLDPTTIPKYVTPLVIPPVMNNDGTADSYDIAVRQFRQQILPGGIWNTINERSDAFDATQVWSYGPAADVTPTVAPDPASQFNYPAYTVETLSNTQVDVRWINDLVDAKGKYLPHLLDVDQTVHWANPLMDCRDGTKRTDCAGVDPEVYDGPVPIVTHVHGAHVDPHSDGYPEAWWLPAGVPGKYAKSGSLFDDATGMNPGNLGYADYSYIQTQPATTLWYHDHTLGMTRLNVYAGPAGFWLIRGRPGNEADDYDQPTVGAGGPPATLPGPAPVAGQGVLPLNIPGDPVRNSIREIPIVIQDRSFDQNGKKLFYPKNRAFFEGLEPKDLKIDFAPISDVLPIWNPEAFFNVMVVNGVSWPSINVAQDRYRLRLLNGCNSRFLNLSMCVVDPDTEDCAVPKQEVPFYQIGAEQGFLPQVVRIQTGEAVMLPGDGTEPAPAPNPADPTALLMGLAERADVIVDFSGLPVGTVVRMINTAPDAPFGGFPDDPADPDTTGQVMEFVVDSTVVCSVANPCTDGKTTNPANLVLNAEDPLGMSSVTRQVSLNELESEVVCVLLDVDADAFIEPIKQVDCATPDPDGTIGAGIDVVPFGPTEALLGTVTGTGVNVVGNPLKWTDTTGASTPVPVTMADGVTVKMINVTENPTVGDTETWEIYNFTADAHPIHLHLVRFEVVDREVIGGAVRPAEPWETGFKDTVIAYPDEITRVKATFDIAGLYVWHCHIVEHEDNEMMRPYVVSP
jgi:FtsP/CotA-like multicopper oxidase with cupredoxin domain